MPSKAPGLHGYSVRVLSCHDDKEEIIKKITETKLADSLAGSFDLSETKAHLGPKGKGAGMPVITVEGPRIADLGKKRKLARDFTQAASEAFGLPKETIVVILHETSPECVASGGELICDRPAAERQSSS